MSTPSTITGTAKVWTTREWQGIDQIDHLIRQEKCEEAISGMHYTNHNMSSVDEWFEVGIAQITVTFYPRDKLVSKELDGLKKQLEKVRGENHMRENAILDRISKLTAIEYTGEQS